MAISAFARASSGGFASGGGRFGPKKIGGGVGGAGFAGGLVGTNMGLFGTSSSPVRSSF